MKLKKGIRIFLWGSVALVAVAAALYLLRWPLLEGVVRRKVAELVAKELHAEIDIGRLGGSLIFGIQAQDLRLRPAPGSPFRSAGIERVSAEYGFLGSGEPTLTVEGARIALSRKDGPAPPLHQTIRDAVSVLRSLRFPGRVRVTKGELVLPDGRSVQLDRAVLDHAAWTLALRSEGFGTVAASSTLLPDGALTLEARATEGPARSAKIELGPGAEQASLRIAAEVLDHPLNWTGTAFFEKGQLLRVDGDLVVKEGRAKTRVDLVTGRVEADVDAVVAVDRELKGDLAVSGRGEGPLAGPPEDWTLREGRVRTRGARFRAFRIDDADVALGPGSLSKISFKGHARSGKDLVDAEGLFRWTGKADVEATVRAAAADVAPYLALLPEPPRLKARELRAEGKLLIRDGAVSYDGLLVTGPAEFEGVPWEAATFKGSLGAGRIEARELIVTGHPAAPSITASGKLEGETLSLRFAAGGDEGEIGGRFEKNGDFEGRIRLEGPMTWLQKQFDITLAEEFKPVRAAGKVRREKDDTRVLLDLTAGAGTSMSPTATIRRQENDWILVVAPGTITLPKRRVDYGALVLSLSPGRASLEDLKLSCTDPELSARVSGSVAWDAKETKAVFRMLDTTVAGTPIDPLFARVTIDRASGEIQPNLRWGKEDGDHLRVSGRWGRELDLRADLRANDLKRPLLRRFLPSLELEGGVALEAHVTGTPDQVQISGTLTLSKVSTAGLPPLSLVIPLKSEEKTLRLWSVTERTPYGAVTLEGTIPLPGSAAPVDLRLRILTDDLSPLLDRLTPQARPWIPRGSLSAELVLHGPPLKTELRGRAEFIALRFKPPAPLAEASDLRVVARLDAEGVAIEMTDGLLGKGPFWASGRWDLFLPDRPLSLWITAWDALVVDDPLTRIRVKPDVVLTWREGRAVRLSGRVEIPLAIYHREFTASTPGGRTARQISPPRLRLIPGDSGGFLIPGIAGLEGLELDLAFATSGEVRLENSVVGVMIQAEGRLGGTAAEPELSAVIRSRENRGEVKLAPGNFLRIESAEAILPDEIGRRPTLRFQGRVGAGEGAIQVLVDGPLDNPSLLLKTDPPQPQKDLLAKLAFGLGTGAVSGETGVATLAIYFYEQTQDAWPSADRKEGFFDKLRPMVIPGETSQQRRVPWELPPAGTLRSTSLRTEYVYNSFFSIVAETNREGDVGGDLKLRIRF